MCLCPIQPIRYLKFRIKSLKTRGYGSNQGKWKSLLISLRWLYRSLERYPHNNLRLIRKSYNRTKSTISFFEKIKILLLLMIRSFKAYNRIQQHPLVYHRQNPLKTSKSTNQENQTQRKSPPALPTKTLFKQRRILTRAPYPFPSLASMVSPQAFQTKIQTPQPR